MSDLIDRQRAIDAIDKIFPSDSRHNEYTRGIACGAALAMEYIKQLPSAQQWIPVTERLPEDEEMKLVTCRTKKGILNVNRAYYMDGAWHGSGSMSGVIAWMEMPEPYREDTDE